ncbi:hypothetical protein K503DRAFT_799829 [Rhizopogon vinicolor AM-OR11-026]|uniref:Uncharacterized protein n=1 Tax=Rhizopogon vinicolor AM-OR11-026 TaxID=1314800 RepID=A0A1B7N2Y7_9AGAM|nr:hypothetical protein K503DRAFT_799829 [Rhizopogon vinicolor AM-OR11-026]
MSTTLNEKLSSSQKLHETVVNRLTEVGAKDQRAHERARHQTKERREHAMLMERKERAATARVMGLKERAGPRPGKKATMESWDGDEPEYRAFAGSDRPATIAPVPGNRSGFPKIALADFVTFKTKKPSKALDADFEVLPPVRSVIALDDFGRDIEADEPWEFITLTPESPAWKGLSYAQAAALAV